MQNGVNLTTNEKDIKVNYGMYNLGSVRDGAFTSLKYILSDLNDIRKYYIRLGFHLHEFGKYKYFEDFGYLTLQEFVDANLGLDKTTVSRCINIYLNFSALNDKTYKNGVHTRGSGLQLSEKYEEYSYSQLCEMLSMDEDQRKMVKPEMSIKQIREIKKGNVSQLNDSLSSLDKLISEYKKRNVSQINENVSQVATSQQAESFDYDKFVSLKGAARKSYFNKFDGDSCVLYLFDNDGNEITGFNCCNIFYKEGSHYFIKVGDLVLKEIQDYLEKHPVK